MTRPTAKAPRGFVAAIDYGPLAVFFVANFLLPARAAVALVGSVSSTLDRLPDAQAEPVARVIVASAAFMIATLVAMVASRVRLGRISPMLWISGGLVLVFGLLTVWFRDPRFLQMKPTIVYVMLAAVLGFGLVTGRPLLEGLLGSAYPGLSAAGWRRLTRNWALFFLGMAALNEAVWRLTSWDFWVGYKLWGALPLTLIFAMAQVPMLMRHGLMTGDAAPPLPPDG